MEFEIRRAVSADIPEIMRIMEAAANPEHPDWYIQDDEPYMRKRVSEDGRSTKDGFTLAAQAPNGEIAGYFVVTYPDPEKNLGHFLSYSPEQIARAVMMDTASVGAKYRGYKLQRRMAEAAEEEVIQERKDVKYLLCMIHPDNVYSLSNMQELGYVVRKEAIYHGRWRYVLEKVLESAGIQNGECLLT